MSEIAWNLEVSENCLEVSEDCLEVSENCLRQSEVSELRQAGSV